MYHLLGYVFLCPHRTAHQLKLLLLCLLILLAFASIASASPVDTWWDWLWRAWPRHHTHWVTAGSDA